MNKSVATAYHQPGIKAIVYDIESVCRIAQNYINKTSSVKENVTTYCGNMFSDSFPYCNDEKNGYQAIFFSNVFHDWNEEKCEYLMKKSFDSLPQNGVILIHEALLDDDGNGPLTAACYSFSMFLKSEGKQFTFNELKTLLIKTGFKNIDLLPTYGIYSVVYGKK